MKAVFIHGGCVRDGDRPGLAADAAEVRSVLSNLGPTIVVAHSYGGVVATEAADAPYLELAADGTFGVRIEMAEDLFLHDCDSAAIAGALARLTRQTTAVTTEPVHRAAWRTTPSTYLVCAEDRATPPAVQRIQAQRAHRVGELPAGHHPMLSHPELLAREVLTGAGVTA